MWKSKNNILLFENKKFLIITTTKKIFCNKNNLIKVLRKININKNYTILVCEQVHGNKIKFVSKTNSIKKLEYKISFYKNVDGIVTDNINNLICIFTADCVPLFVFNEEKSIFGLIHVGRKGVLSGIVEKLLTKIEKYEIRNFKFVLGPHICEKCYKVDVGCVKNALFGFDNQKNMFSLEKEILGRLIKRGVNKKQVIKTKYCTSHNYSKFYSYRRGDKEKRLVSLILKKIKY